MVPFKNDVKRSAANNYRPFSLFSMVIKIIGFFFYFQYDVKCSRSLTDLVIVLSDRIARPFSKSGATRAVALDISKAFDKV